MTTALDVFKAARSDGLTFSEARIALGLDAWGTYRALRELLYLEGSGKSLLTRTERVRKAPDATRNEQVYVLREFA